MTDNNEQSRELVYPAHFDPAKFAHPTILWNILQQPEIVDIGPEIRSRDQLAIIAEGFDGIVDTLSLTHARGGGRSVFPVFKREPGFDLLADDPVQIAVPAAAEEQLNG